MKAAVFSDIHGNVSALDACIEEIQKEDVDRLIFLGDYVTDLPNSRRVMDVLYRLQREYPCIFLRGNREDYLLAHQKGESGWVPGSQCGALLYAYSQMTTADLRFFEALPVSHRLTIPGHPTICLCHGAPGSNRDILVPGGDLTRYWAKETEESILLCGHTHRVLDFWEGEKRIVNFGSVGLPLGGDLRASMGILESGGGDWRFTRRGVEYSPARELEDFVSGGLAEMGGWWAAALARELLTGENLTMALLLQAKKLLNAQDEVYPIPEIYWEQAAKILEIPPLL